MKFSKALGMGLALAPLSTASGAHNALVPRNMKAELIERTNHVNKMVNKQVNKQVNNQVNNQVNRVGQGNGGSGQATQVIILWVQSGGGERTQINQKATITENPNEGGGQTAVNPAQAGTTQTVRVGGPGGMLTFQPQEIQAKVGTVVVFEFFAKNHSVTQCTFDKPCVKSGQDSDFQPNPNNIGLETSSGNNTKAPEFAIQVMDAAPTWWYCKQTGHCGKGMVFSINATPEKSHAAFQSMAIAQNGTGMPSPITGGGASNPAQGGGEGQQPSAGGGSETQQAGTIGAGSGAGGQTAVGTGTVNENRTCDCVAACAAGAFPAAQMQGLRSFGGMAGSIPANVNMTSKRR